jgi:ribosomal protein S18 acetylase RimI-like enzyme
MATPESDLDAIDQAFVAQWSVFGQGPGGTFHDEGDLVWIEASIPQLPYNAIIKVRLGDDAHDRLAPVVEHFREIGHQVMCPVMPMSTPANLSEILEAVGLSPVDPHTGMSLDLATRELVPPPLEADGIAYREVASDAHMAAYEELVGFYWELPDEAREFFHGISRWGGHGPDAPGVRWVAYLDGQPVGKAYGSLRGQRPDVVGIFGVSVRNEARGRGVASILTEHLLQRAKELGRRRAVLHSTPMAVNLYRRLGFVERCDIPTYATTHLHALQTS